MVMTTFTVSLRCGTFLSALERPSAHVACVAYTVLYHFPSDNYAMFSHALN